MKISGLASSKLRGSEGAGRKAVLLLEEAAERAERLKANSIANIGNGEIALAQEFGGFLQTQTAQIAVRRFVEGTLKFADEVIRR
jgi:hypothetical protein